MKVLNDAFEQMWTTGETLFDSSKSDEEKRAATAAYMKSAAKLMFMKHWRWCIEYAEEINFGAAVMMWGGYRGYSWIMGASAAMEPLKEKMGELDSMVKKAKEMGVDLSGIDLSFLKGANGAAPPAVK